jgi:hypothetical protein
MFIIKTEQPLIPGTQPACTVDSIGCVYTAILYSEETVKRLFMPIVRPRDTLFGNEIVKEISITSRVVKKQQKSINMG